MSASTQPVPAVAPAAPARATTPAAGPAATPAVERTAAAAPARPRRDPVRTAARLSPLLGLVLSASLVWWGMQAGVLDSLEHLQTFISSLGAWGPAAFMLVTAALVVFPVIPGGLTAVAGPVLFGPVEGIVFTYIAVCAGLTLNFVIGRHIGLGLIERLLAPRTVTKVLGWTEHRNFTRAFATAITLPIAPDDVLCYIAGTTRMRMRTFMLIILLGKPWSLMLYGLGVSTLILKLLPW